MSDRVPNAPADRQLPVRPTVKHILMLPSLNVEQLMLKHLGEICGATAMTAEFTRYLNLYTHFIGVCKAVGVGAPPVADRNGDELGARLSDFETAVYEAPEVPRMEGRSVNNFDHHPF